MLRIVGYMRRFSKNIMFRFSHFWFHHKTFSVLRCILNNRQIGDQESVPDLKAWPNLFKIFYR